MKGNMSVGKIKGIKLEVHLSWIVIIALVTFTMATSYLPKKYTEWSDLTVWIVGIITSIMLFISVLLHEIAHAVVAEKLNIKVKKIGLVLLGGSTEMEKEPDEPSKEFRIAISGPTANFILYLIFSIISKFLILKDFPDTVYITIEYVANMNLALAIFNMIPSLPLDGGRALRGLAWYVTKSLKRATGIVRITGNTIGNIFIFIGVFMIFTGSFFEGIWICFIGWFVLQSSNLSYQSMTFSDMFKKIKIEEFMSSEVITIQNNLSIDSVIKNYFYKYQYTSFPVLDENRLVGVITLELVKGTQIEERSNIKLSEIMTPITSSLVVNKFDTMDIAMNKVFANAIGRVLVLENEDLVGFISKTDILNYIKVYNELH